MLPKQEYLLWTVRYLHDYACMQNLFSHVWLFATLWTVAHQAPLSMGFSRQEYWSGLSCPPPGDLPDSGIKPKPLMSPALASRFFTTNHLEIYIVLIHIYLVILCPCLALPKLIQKSKSSGVPSGQAGLNKGIDIRGWKEKDLCYTMAKEEII